MMSNQLPPAWAKHLKTKLAPKASPPKGALPNAPPKPTPRHEHVGDMLLRQAVELQQANRLQEAQELCHRVLDRTPDHPLSLYLLGTLLLGYDDEMALRYFARATGEEPNNAYYHLSLGEAYLKVSEFAPAIHHIQHALELKPDLVEALCSLGRAYVAFDKPDLALPLYERALKVNRNHPLARVGLASALTALGRMAEAASCLKEAIEKSPVVMPVAYKEWAQIRSFTEEPMELQSILREIEGLDPNQGSAQHLHYAAGKILNDLKRYEEAFDHFKKAKEFAGQEFNIEAHRRWVDSIIELFTPEMLAARRGYGNPSEVPVFIVGMPRSGTTLTEQICASHPGVHGAGELSKLRRVANAIGFKSGSAGNVRQAVASLSAELSKTLADEHLSYLRQRAPDALRIVDKMPHNFELIGLIGILFPNARIVHCRRNPIDNCLSCFVLNFSKSHDYNADLETLGLYYREYDRLMRHWAEVFPGLIFESHYEALIEDQEERSRQLIDYLGLPWHDACLRFFDRDGVIATPSRWQVRQPIYNSSVKRWKNYEAMIQPLIESLGDLADV